MTQREVDYQMLFSQLEQSNRQIENLSVQLLQADKLDKALVEKLTELTQQVCDLTKKIEELTLKQKDMQIPLP